MKKVIVCMILIFSMLLCGGCGNDQAQTSGHREENNTMEQLSDKRIADAIGVQSIKLEIGNIRHSSSGDTAVIVAQIPNFTDLFTAVCDADDMTAALLMEIDKGNFTTVEYTGKVSVTYDGDTPVFDTDPIVKRFMEQELIKAINAVTESENAT